MDQNTVLLGAGLGLVATYMLMKPKEKMCRGVEHMRGAPAERELFIMDNDPKGEAVLQAKRSDRSKDETVSVADLATKNPAKFVPALWPVTEYNPPRIDTRSEW
jgi:hypothetical protein